MKTLDFVARYEYHKLDPDLLPDFPIAQVLGEINGNPPIKSIYGYYDLIFCPGNSFGHMTGGFDLGVVQCFGQEVEDKVKEMINKKYFGMMPVGASEIVFHDNRGFVYTPTMMVPTSNIDPITAYTCMYSAYLKVLEVEKEFGQEFELALCPLYGAGTGGINPKVALKQQCMALKEISKAMKSGEPNECSHLFKDGKSRYETLRSH